MPKVPRDCREEGEIGDAERTIVLLPGLGTASPALDFTPLVDELQDEFRVVVVEPFGYGLSDQTESPRTSANIIGEVHDAPQELGIDRYVLGGHSIAGIYGIEYVNRFRGEVTAFVGIDSSVPTQPGGGEKTDVGAIPALKALGLLRLLTALAPDPYDGLPYDATTNGQLSILGHRNSMTPTMLDEISHTPENFEHARSRSFPRNIPLLLFAVSNAPELPGWVRLHEAQVEGVDRGQFVPLEGGHYLHHTKSAEIDADIGLFLQD